MEQKKLYNVLLHKKFNHYTNTNGQKLLRDKDGQNFGWQYNDIENSKKILYVSGCSWTHENFCQRTLINHFSDSLIINRSIGGQGNSMIIDTLKKDLNLLKNANHEVFYLICLSEVGRNIKDFSYTNPKNYNSTHKYFEEILKKQYSEIKDLLSGQKQYVTTSFVNNSFNNNSSILDFCGNNKLTRPNNHVYNFNTGIYDWMKNKKIYNFDFEKDLQILQNALEWLSGFEFVDSSLHPNSYKPYEDFVKNLNSNT